MSPARIAALDLRQIATRHLTFVVGASLLIALCAQITWYSPISPVPLSLQNFGVFLVALALGPWRGAAAATLYLSYGAVGLPVFTPGSAGLLGATGGYLVAYPAVAFLAGWLAHRGLGALRARSFGANAVALTAANLLLFAAGVSWFMLLTGSTFAQAIAFAVYPFIFFEVIKIMVASALIARWNRVRTF